MKAVGKNQKACFRHQKILSWLKQNCSLFAKTGINHLLRRRVPIRLQLSSVECGAACLAMILSYYGRNTKVAECYERLGIGRDGVTARSIANVARSYGLRVKAYSIETADFQYVQLPAIVHWNNI